MPMRVMTVKVPEEIALRLDRLASVTRRPKGYYIRELLSEHLAEMEDAYLALERVAQPGAKYFTSEEVKKNLGL